LVHPLYNLMDGREHNSSYFIGKWRQSMAKVSDDAYGILVLANSGYPEKKVSQVIDDFKDTFPLARRTILRNDGGGPIRSFKLANVYDLSELEVVSARGFWVEQCLRTGLKSLLEEFDIPENKARIEFEESATTLLRDSQTERIQTRFEKRGDRYNLVLPEVLSTEEKKEYTGLILSGEC